MLIITIYFKHSSMGLSWSEKQYEINKSTITYKNNVLDVYTVYRADSERKVYIIVRFD